jgi:hypothetical protein
MFDDLIQKYSSGGDQGGATPPTASVGGDIAGSAGSRLAAGVLDIPGTIGDLPNLADNLGSAAARGILGLFGVSPENRQRAQAVSDELTKGQLSSISPLNILPTSEKVKKAVGFQAYQPQTAAGKIFDKYVGTGIEAVPGLVASGGSNILKTAAQQGLKAAAKQGAGDVAKYALAPSAASEVAGDVTKGTPLEPWARLGAALVTGGVTGRTGQTVTGALTGDQWRAVADQAYADVRNSGVAVNSRSFTKAVDDITQTAHTAGFLPELPGHGDVKGVLDELNRVKGVPQSFEELDRLHRVAAGAANSAHPDARRLGGMIAGKIDDYMENLKPGDLIAPPGVSPNGAFKTLLKGRDAWRRMRSGERIANILAQSFDVSRKNYTAAGHQTALKQEFGKFKWAAKNKLTREYERLSSDEKRMVDGIIQGGNKLRLIGKLNFRNPVISMLLGILGISTGHPFLAVSAAAGAEAARHISSRGTLKQVEQLGEVLRGGKVTPGRWGRPPNAVFLGAAAQRETDRSKQGRQ